MRSSLHAEAYLGLVQSIRNQSQRHYFSQIFNDFSSTIRIQTTRTKSKFFFHGSILLSNFVRRRFHYPCTCFLQLAQAYNNKRATYRSILRCFKNYEFPSHFFPSQKPVLGTSCLTIPVVHHTKVTFL